MSNFGWAVILDVFVVVLLVVVFTKAGRALMKKLWQRKYKETDGDSALKRAVLTFAERTAAMQQQDRVDMNGVNRQLRNFIVALAPLHTMSEAKQEYFFEVGWEHAARCLRNAETAEPQRGQVRQMRR